MEHPDGSIHVGTMRQRPRASSYKHPKPVENTPGHNDPLYGCVQHLILRYEESTHKINKEDRDNIFQINPQTKPK